MSTKKNDEMRAKLLLKPKTEDAIAALQKDPDNGDLWYAYAMSLKDGEAAIDAFCEGLIRNPFMPILYFGRGRKNLSARRYRRAVSDFTMSIRLDPEIYSFWYYRAVTNNLSGAYEDAIYDFQRAMEQTEPWERYGLIDWQFVTYVEMGDRKRAKEVIDAMPPDLEAPPMHYAYKRRVLLYKGLISPEEFIDEDDIRARMVDQEDRFTLEIATLLFGLYIYYVYIDDQKKADETLLRLMDNMYPGAFGCIKGEAAARKRGLIK